MDQSSLYKSTPFFLRRGTVLCRKLRRSCLQRHLDSCSRFETIGAEASRRREKMSDRSESDHPCAFYLRVIRKIFPDDCNQGSQYDEENRIHQRIDRSYTDGTADTLGSVTTALMEDEVIVIVSFFSDGNVEEDASGRISTNEQAVFAHPSTCWPVVPQAMKSPEKITNATMQSLMCFMCSPSEKNDRP